MPLRINWTLMTRRGLYPTTGHTSGVPETFPSTNYTVCQDPFAAPAPAGPYLSPGGKGIPCGTDTPGGIQRRGSERDSESPA